MLNILILIVLSVTTIDSSKSLKYVYFKEYDAYVRVYNCSTIVEKEVLGNKNLIIVPKDSCNIFFVICISQDTNEWLEYGLYKLDENVMKQSSGGRNDIDTSKVERKYFIANRIGEWKSIKQKNN
jgi:hypothetical protein